MARLLAGASWAPRPPKAEPKVEPKPTRRAWPPPVNKEQGLGTLRSLTFEKLVEIGLIDKEGRLVQNRRGGPRTLGELAQRDGRLAARARGGR
jgi:hypothetical protein